MRFGLLVGCLLAGAFAAASEGCGGTITSGRDAAGGTQSDGGSNGGASGTSGTGGTAGSAGTGGLGPCACSQGQVCCNDETCVSTVNDTNHCGACNNACGGELPICWEWICRRASCEPNTACTTPQKCCGSACCGADQLCCYVGQSTAPTCVTVTADAPFCPRN